MHFLRDMLGHCSKAQQPMIAAAIRQIFAAEDAVEARERLAGVAAALEQSAPKVARLLSAAEEELIAFMAFPAGHWSKLRSTNPLERVNREIGRRSDVVGIYPNDAALVRLAGALLIEQDDFVGAWQAPSGTAPPSSTSAVSFWARSRSPALHPACASCAFCLRIAHLRQIDPLVQRRSSPSGARLSDSVSAPCPGTAGGGSRRGEHDAHGPASPRPIPTGP